jgi:hypothetical protein
MDEINNESTTMYIANRRDIIKFNRYSPLQLHIGLIGLKPAISLWS